MNTEVHKVLRTSNDSELNPKEDMYLLTFNYAHICVQIYVHK